MLTVLALTLTAFLPQDTVVCEFVDLIEVNHVCDDRGRTMYTQALFYEWRPQRSDYQLRAARLLLSPEERPERDFRRGDWAMLFTAKGTLREVRAPIYRETWTQYDVEQAERERLPREYRPGLLFERQIRRES